MNPQTKLWSLVGASAIIAALFSYTLHSFSYADSSFMWPTILGLIFIVFISALSPLLTSNKLAASVSALFAVSLALPLMGYLSLGFAALVLLVFLFLWRSLRHGFHDSKSRLQLDIWKISRSALPACFTALMLIASLVFISSFIKDDFTVARGGIRALLSPTPQFLAGFLGIESEKISFDTKVKNILSEAVKIKAKQQLAQIASAEREAAIEKLSSESLSLISQNAGIKISAQETLLDILERSSNLGLSKVPVEYRSLVFISVGTIIFLLLRSFGFLVKYPAEFLSWALYKALLSAKFLKIVKEPAERESVSL